MAAHAPQSPIHAPPSPPLPSLHSLSISPYPPGSPGESGPAGLPGSGPAGGGAADYRYPGVFGPPHVLQGQGPPQLGQQVWGSDGKRGSRSGLPTNWYDPPSTSPLPPSFDPLQSYRYTSPALSPPTSSSSIPSASSTNPSYPFQPPPYASDGHAYLPGVGMMGGAIGLAGTPSPPPLAFGQGMNMSMGMGMGMGGMSTASSAPNLGLQAYGQAYPLHHPASPPSLSHALAPAGASGGYGSQSLSHLSRQAQGYRHPYSPPSATPPSSTLPTPVGGSGSGYSTSPSYSGAYPSSGLNTAATSGGGGAEDDVIPTAIVIKNIPFSVPRELLLSIIESLGAPLPYAFNYHHDGGIFRGLAFANFRAPDEAAAVVAALNGYDVSGRKLRVEYKKVLQPGEKDRIEREKALKRMRSVGGFDKSNGVGGEGEAGHRRNESREQPASAAYGSMGPPKLPVSRSNNTSIPNGSYNPHAQTYSHAHSHSQSQASHSLGSQFAQQYHHHHQQHALGQHGYLGLEDAAPPSPPRSSGSLSSVSASGSFSGAGGASASAPASHPSGSSDSSSLPIHLDMNNPTSLDIYSRCLLFKEDRMRDELSFSRSLSASDRRIVHLVAQKLGLVATTKTVGTGENETKSVVVTRDSPSPATSRPSLTTSHSHSTTTPSAYLSPYGSAPLHLHPDASVASGVSGNAARDGGLRVKKSMPDLRGFGGPLLGRGEGRGMGLSSQRSSGNLRDGSTSGAGGGRDYVSMSQAGARRMLGQQSGDRGSGGFNSIFGNGVDVPPVPALPTAFGSGRNSTLGVNGTGGSGLGSSPVDTSAATTTGGGGGGGGSSAPTRHPRGPAGESRGFATTGALNGSNGSSGVSNSASTASSNANGTSTSGSGGVGAIGDTTTTNSSYAYAHGQGQGQLPRSLRSSVSAIHIRPSSGFGLLGKGVKEEEEGEILEGSGAGAGAGVEAARTRESLDL